MIDPQALARLTLFADLDAPHLHAVAQLLDEESFARGTRVLREGISGSAFYVIVEGAVDVCVGGEPRTRLGAGDFFGEGSILTGEPPVADVIAATEEVRCGVLAGSELRPLLLEHPAIALRMLEASARRLRTTTLWAG